MVHNPRVAITAFQSELRSRRGRSRTVLAMIATFLMLLAHTQPSVADERPDFNGAVFAIGDSVMLGARPCMEARGYRVDAKGSRQVYAGADTLAAMPSLPRWVITHFGTNGGLDDQGLDALMAVLGHERHVIMVTVQLPDGTDRYTFEDRTNEAIRRMPTRYPNVQVVDWNKASNAHPEWTWGDGIHLTPAGCRAFTALLEPAVRRPLAESGLPGTAWRMG